MAGNMLARPDPSQRIYIQMVYYKDRMGEVILQAYESVEAITF